MPVYVDKFRALYRGMVMGHMVADTRAELHTAAENLGLQRRWFQDTPKSSVPHYDISRSKRAEGNPPSPAPIGQHPTATEWANEYKSNSQINYEMREKGQRNKARGILKHGPYGSGEAGPCDAGCAKCATEKGKQTSDHLIDATTYAWKAMQAAGKQLEKEGALQSFVAIQRENTAVLKQPKHEREMASAEWSAQLRAKVAEAKRRDAEAARYTPWWSPEEQSGDDL